jgi:2-keto-3-deoxy-L-fuconate dehydrogenase
MKLKDKAVLITGAGSGLGREMALVFTREGAKIGVNDLRPEAAQNVVTEIERAGGRAVRLVADVSDSAEVKKIFGEFVAASARSTSWSTTPASAACVPAVRRRPRSTRPTRTGTR